MTFTAFDHFTHISDHPITSNPITGEKLSSGMHAARELMWSVIAEGAEAKVPNLTESKRRSM
jgi:hypothetical protein